VPTCAVVISLLSSKPHENLGLGQDVASWIEAVLQREKEPDLQPVLKEGVAEVLRRRLFTPASTRPASARMTTRRCASPHRCWPISIVICWR